MTAQPCKFRLLLPPDERLHLRSLGDVTIYATVALKSSLGISDWPTTAFKQNHFAVLAQGLVLQRPEDRSFLNYFTENLTNSFCFLFWHKHEGSLADQVLRAKSEDILHVRANISVCSFLIKLPQDIVGVLNQTAKSFLGFTQCLLHPLALGDVQSDPDEAVDLSLCVPDRKDTVMYPTD